MNLRFLLREVWRDITSGTARTLALGLVALAAFGVPVVADAATGSASLRAAYDFQASGASILRITAPDAIHGRACESLSRATGVLAAGAISVGSDPAALALLPSAPVTVITSSPRFAAVLGAPVDGAIVSADIADALGAADGEGIATSLGELRLTGTYGWPSDGRITGFGWALVQPDALRDTFDECWVRVWPVDETIRQLLLTALSADAPRETEVEIEQINGRHGSLFDGWAGHSTRITGFAPALVLVLGCVLGLGAVRRRRIEITSRLHDGATHRDIGILILLETAAWVIPAAVVALGSVALIAAPIPSADRDPLVAAAACAVSLGVLGVVGSTAASLLVLRARMLSNLVKGR